MPHPLIGIHAVLGELGIFAFVWVFVELLNLSEERLRRARVAAMLGLLFFVLSWVVGGWYYVSFYGSNVKPVIKEGPQPWAHSVVMEAKEHIFLFLPFLALVVVVVLWNLRVGDARDVKSALWLVGLIVVLGLLMALMGYFISSGFRGALEVMHVP